jgi:tetratricopeptide (TPR) repeat protein
MQSPRVRQRALRGAAATALFVSLVCVGSSPARAQDLESVKPTSSADAVYERGARALRQGRNDEAIEHLSTAARLAPDDPRVLSAYAQALIGAGRQDEAVQILRQARGTRTVDEDLALGVVNYELERWDDAAANLRRAVQRDPSNGAAHLFLASALIELKQYDEAMSELDAARDRDEWLAAEVETRKGRIEMERGNRNAAEAHFREAERLAPATLLGALARRTVGRPEPRDWSVFFTVGAAYDTNVNLAGEDPVSGDDNADYRLFAEIGADWDIVKGDKFNLRIGGNAFISRHGDERDFDLLQTRAFAIAAYELPANLTGDLRYTYEYIWTDPAALKDFRRTHLVEPSLRWRPRQDLQSRVFYRYEKRAFFPTRGPFPARFLPPPFDTNSSRRLDPLDRDGDVQNVGLEQYWFTPDYTGWGRGFLRGGFRWRKESTQGGDFDSRGPVANFLFGQPLPFDFYLIGEAEYDRRDYAQVSSVGLLLEAQRERRQDDIWSGRVVLRRPLTSRMTGEISYRYMHWGSNVDFYRFTRHIVNALVTYRY